MPMKVDSEYREYMERRIDDARRERDEARATLAELKEHGIDIDNGVWTGRVRLPDGSSPMTDEIEEAFKERDALRAECDDLHRTIDVLRAEMSELRNAASHSRRKEKP